MDTTIGNRDQLDEEAASGPDIQRRQRSSIPSFLFISFLFFMLNNHNEEDAVARFQYKDIIQVFEHQLSNYSSWLAGNESNFYLPIRSQYLDPLVQRFLSFGSELNPALGSYYTNVSAIFRGDVSFYNLSSISEDQDDTLHTLAHNFMNGTNITSIPQHLGTWNWTNTDKIGIKIHDRKVTGAVDATEDIAIFHGKVELFDSDVSDTIILDFDGAHFVNNGSFYAFAEEDGRASLDIRYTPNLVPEHVQNRTARILEIELSRRLSKIRDAVDFSVLDELPDKNDQAQSHKCPFILYGQLEPSPIPRYLMEELEQEIEKPSGITIVTPPKMSMNGVLVSQQCGILFEISGTSGLKTLSFNRRVTTYAGASAILYLVLLILLSRQISRSRTPAGVSKISRWTFLTQGLVDTISFVLYITLAAAVEGRASLSLIAPAALACILFVYEMQFAVLIYRIQLPEDTVVDRPSPAPAPVHIPPPTPPDISPNDVLDHGESTTVTPPIPAIIPTPTPVGPSQNPQQESFWRFFVHHFRTDPQARLWLSMSLFLMIMFRVIMILSLPLFSMMVAYSLFWLPQIVRSAQRGRTCGLSKEYLVGTTICRLCFAFYFLAYADNILNIQPRSWIYTFACWMFFQIFVVVLQDFYGPAFFLPSRFAMTNVYDYHPPMSVPDSESPERSLGDCSICMEAIVVESPNHVGEKEHSDTRSSSGRFFSAVQRGVVGAAAARKEYSLAPCHHLFHTTCLERWLAIKNICPQCRRPLPPL